MIEVLVTIVIIAFGLLGMAGLQSRLQVSEMEAYQRAQALVLLNDMVSRISTDRPSARNGDFVTGSAIGPDTNCSTLGTDLQEWCNALKGAAARKDTANVGGVIGGRGCVEDLGNNEYMVTVSWQGMVPLAAPPASVACGKDLYDTAGSTGCVSDLCRRVVTSVIRLAPLL